ncbi:MAG: DNA/RNA nuclease SfsA [Proteobacteria bacterium]|nr:DNA/RNA nuclease SfsA [Pseudomonadota bacterium]MBU1611377.1 DNA/RNA nuclease SfsA [Pseudomonadota bacterium]
MNELIVFPDGCIHARLVARLKRFTVLAEREGEELRAHTNNTGSMLGLLRPGSEILFSPALGSHRKLKWTWELASVQGAWVGINTLTPNRLLYNAWQKEVLPEVRGYDVFQKERAIGESRLDAYLTGPQGQLWVECKNVTLVEDEVALFPDAVTERGQRHLRELTRLALAGERVALFFLVQRPDARCFAPAEMIDPVYAELFYLALDAGVEAWPYVATISERGIGLGKKLNILD